MRAGMTTAMELAGIALMVAGVGFVFWPAALIVAGIALVLLGWLTA